MNVVVKQGSVCTPQYQQVLAVSNHQREVIIVHRDGTVHTFPACPDTVVTLTFGKPVS